MARGVGQPEVLDLSRIDYKHWPNMLRPGEVATIFKVDPKTVTRWVLGGRVEPEDYIYTPGGHLRFRKEAIYKLYQEEEVQKS